MTGLSVMAWGQAARMPPRWTAWMLTCLLALGAAACGSSGKELERPAAERSSEATATARPQVAEAPDFRRAQRSPAPYLDRAGEAALPIDIGHGLEDSNVPVTHSVRAFNQLAAADDRLPPAFVRAVADQRLPDAARGSIETPTFFGDRDPEVLFARRSGDIKLVIFEGGHDMVYNPGLEWMQRLAAGAPVDTSE